jgi:hypothetical protein
MPERSKIDTQKIDDAVLALLFLGLHGDKYSARAWKSHDWDSLSRLHEAGYIHDPVGKAKSVSFTEEGLKRSEELLKNLFGQLPDRSIDHDVAESEH